MTVTKTEDTPSTPPELHDLRLREVWDAIAAPSVKAVSTDVFDTLVWRTVPEPVDVFPIVAERLRERDLLAPDLSIHAFGRLRQSAERHARRQRVNAAGDSEVRLAEIYGALPEWIFAGDAAGRELALQAELEVEREAVVPDLDVVELLDAAQAAGKLLLAVSDIYLSAAHLRHLFAQPALSRLHFDGIFTSSDHREHKAGGLHEIALQAHGLEPAQVVHIGDNLEADYRAARKVGIRAFHLERLPEPLRSVTEMETPFLPPPGESVPDATLASGLTAVRSKVLSRPGRVELPAGLHPFWDYGATVLGPLFTGFAEWIGVMCEQRGSPRALCLMREGTFLAELIQRAGEYTGRELEAVPFWLNRTLCLRASIPTGARHELERFSARRSPLTVAGLAAQLGVSLSEIPDLAPEAPLHDPDVRDELFDRLSTTESIRTGIVARSRDVRKRVVAYVESVAGDAPELMLVDLGWGATIQGLLQEVLHEAGRDRGIVGLYLLTHAGAVEQVLKGAEVHGFLGDYGFPGAMTELVMRSPELLEQVCMPPHGTQLDLGLDLEPVVAPQLLPALQLVEADAVRKGILAYQREWARYQTTLPGKVPSLAGAVRLLRPILLRSVVSPTASEVATLGAWHHDEGQGSDTTDLVADPAAVPRLRHMDPKQARDLPMKELYWPYGLAAQVDEHWPQLMNAAAAGHISWDALASELDIGRFYAEAFGVDNAEWMDVAPTRNRLGLSSLRGSVAAKEINQLRLRPSERPCVMRIDWIELRCWPQGRSPVTVRLEADEVLRRLGLRGCSQVAASVLLIPGSDAELWFDVAGAVAGKVTHVDLEVAFAAFAIPPVTSGARFRDLGEAERAYDALAGSLSWRITAPLRRAKGKVR